MTEILLERHIRQVLGSADPVGPTLCAPSDVWGSQIEKPFGINSFILNFMSDALLGLLWCSRLDVLG